MQERPERAECFHAWVAKTAEGMQMFELKTYGRGFKQ